MPRTRIRRLFLVDHNQFRDTVMDFTHPETGEALDRICLIGRNGTGKTTALNLLSSFVRSIAGRTHSAGAVEFEHERQRLLRPGGLWQGPFLTSSQPARVFPTVARTRATHEELTEAAARAGGDRWIEREDVQGLDLRAGVDLVASAQAESRRNQGLALSGPPATTLDKALGLLKSFPVHHIISDDHLTDMWRLLVYRVKRRENDRQIFETREENLHKTKATLIEEFDRDHPPVLPALGALWNRLLAPAGLEFDVAGASVPVQLSENLEAYILRKNTGNRIPYSALSTGIRNFLFRIGHLFLLFFQRTYDRSFVFVDEPENSLFPDFLYELMEVYDEVVGPNTQMFFATHNPIVAAQFEPWERVVLDWDDDGFVVASKGVAPKGDDPNDVLTQDFGLPELMGRAGREKWSEYRALRRQIRKAPPGQEKDELVREAAAIGRAYGFGDDAP